MGSCTYFRILLQLTKLTFIQAYKLKKYLNTSFNESNHANFNLLSKVDLFSSPANTKLSPETLNPAGTWCRNEVVLSSMRRQHMATTSTRRHMPVGKLTGRLLKLRVIMNLGQDWIDCILLDYLTSTKLSWISGQPQSTAMVQPTLVARSMPVRPYRTVINWMCDSPTHRLCLKARNPTHQKKKRDSHGKQHDCHDYTFIGFVIS